MSFCGAHMSKNVSIGSLVEVELDFGFTTYGLREYHLSDLHLSSSVPFFKISYPLLNPAQNGPRPSVRIHSTKY